MADGEGRQYHIGLRPGELADHVLVCGDPGRAERFAAAHLSAVEFERRHREYVTFTGICRGQRISVMATGIGADNTEIAVVEMQALLPRATVIRMGSCGALQPGVGLGDLVVSTAAVRLEATSAAYVPPGFPAVADPDVVAELRRACETAGVAHHVGITATAPGFYGAQGRTVGPFQPREPHIVDELARCRVLNLEMEASALFTLATLADWAAGAVCAVYANRTSDTGLTAEERMIAEGRCMDVAATALVACASRIR